MTIRIGVIVQVDWLQECTQTRPGSQWVGQVVLKADPSGTVAPLPHYAQRGLVCVQFNSQARAGASYDYCSNMVKPEFAHNYAQGERLSLLLALLRMENLPEALANKGV